MLLSLPPPPPHAAFNRFSCRGCELTLCCDRKDVLRKAREGLSATALLFRYRARYGHDAGIDDPQLLHLAHRFPTHIRVLAGGGNGESNYAVGPRADASIARPDIGLTALLTRVEELLAAAAPTYTLNVAQLANGNKLSPLSSLLSPTLYEHCVVGHVDDW